MSTVLPSTAAPPASLDAAPLAAGGAAAGEAPAAPPVAPPADDAAGLPARRLGHDALLYGIGMILRRAATFIMLPLYTRMLTPADYGLLQMLDMTLDVVAIIVSAGTTAGVMRFYFKATTEQARRELLASAAILLLGLNLVGSLLMALAAGPIHQRMLGGAGEPFYVVIAAANFTLGELLTVPLLLMQVQGRAGLHSATTLSKLIVQLALNVIFLVVMRWGPLGILVSTLVTNLLVGGVALGWMFRQTGLRMSRAALHDLRRFGVPYQFATAATFILQFGDRFFLEASHGLAAVGLYGFAYQFGFLLDQLGNTPFTKAWLPRRFAHAQAPREIREREDNRDAVTLSLLLTTMALGMTLFVRPALHIIAGPAFRDAAGIVPLVAAAFLVQGWTNVVHFGIDAAERTKLATYILWASAVLVVALYAVLIPPFGVFGAAFATLASFLVRFVLFYVFARRVWPMRYAWRPHLLLALYAIAGAIPAWLVRASGMGLQIAVGVLVLSAYAPLVWRTVLTPAHKALIVSIVRRLPPYLEPGRTFV